MEIKIGVQNVARELVVETNADAETVERAVEAALRPKRLDEVIGQEHLLRPNSPLRRLVEGRGGSSVILYGPPGTGKTTLANALQSRKPFKAFKHSLMEYPELLQDWYRYQNERLREWALDWLEDNDIQPAARQSPTSLLPPPGKPFA